MIGDIERLRLEISELRKDKLTLIESIEEKDEKLKELEASYSYQAALPPKPKKTLQ